MAVGGLAHTLDHMERYSAQAGRGPRVVIVGGGVAGLEAMLALRDLAGSRAEVELHAPRLEFAYRPLAVGEPFGTGRVLHFDLGELAERSGASFRLGSIVAVDGDRRHVVTRDGAEVPYDFLLLAPGVRMLWAVPGAVTFWGVADEGGVAEVVRRLRSGELRRVIFTMPAGCNWPFPAYELALLAASELAKAGVEGAELTIVTPEDEPLQLFGLRAGHQVGRLLAEHGIEVVAGAHPVKFDRGRLQIAPGEPIEADAVVSTPRLEGRRIAGVPHDPAGFVRDRRARPGDRDGAGLRGRRRDRLPGQAGRDRDPGGGRRRRGDRRRAGGRRRARALRPDPARHAVDRRASPSSSTAG